MPSFEVQTFEHQFQTNGEIELIDLTEIIRSYLNKSEFKDGHVLVFCPGSTGAVITTEYEKGVIQDTKQLLGKLIPKGIGYQHDKIDNNAHSHLRACLFGASQTLPIANRKLLLGMWQQIVFIELDVRPRSRTVIIQFSGIK